jgi:glutaredoxin
MVMVKWLAGPRGAKHFCTYTATSPLPRPTKCAMIIEEQACGAIGMSEPKTSAPPKVSFYTKAGCHLCEEAREMLDDIAAQTEFELTEIDIRSNPDIFEEYRYRIPVIIIDATTVVEGRIAYSDLVRAFHV